MRALRWILIAVVAVILVVFAIDNRQEITLSLWPFPFELSTWLYFVVLLALLVGFLLGELVAWMNGRRWRREARLKTRRVEDLERELAAQSPPKEAARQLTQP